MLLYHLVPPFPRILIIKDNANMGRNSPTCSLPVLMNQIQHLSKKKTQAVSMKKPYMLSIKQPQVPSQPKENYLLVFFFFSFISSSFTVSVAQSINRSGFSSDSKVLVISSISSSEMYKVNPFPVLAAPCQLIFHSNLFNTDEVALVTNLGKTSLAKGTTKKSKNAVLLKST